MYCSLLAVTFPVSKTEEATEPSLAFWTSGVVSTGVSEGFPPFRNMKRIAPATTAIVAPIMLNNCHLNDFLLLYYITRLS